MYMYIYIHVNIYIFLQQGRVLGFPERTPSLYLSRARARSFSLSLPLAHNHTNNPYTQDLAENAFSLSLSL